MDFLISVAGKIAEYAIEPVGRQFGYLIYYNTNIQTLKTKVQKLENDHVTMVESVDAATRNGERVLPSVREWVTSVDQICEESRKFLNDQVNENQKCFSRRLPCPDLVSRYRVSRKSTKKSLQVDELLGIKFDRVSIPPPPPSASSMFAGDVEAFASRESTFEAIMKALKDDEVSMIGVYGMGGIGKTTMVKQVAKVAEQSKLIDEFTIAVVSQKPDVRKIQSDIAEMLGLKLDEENESVRASRLIERMNQGKRILLILDDLWAPINLAEIGIPHGRSHARKCCKIVLTSRNLDVCNGMDCHPFIRLGVLSDPDARNFFRGIAGEVVDSPDLCPIATEIIAKCAGLPIAIKSIARALKGKSQNAWEDALHQLRNSTAKNIRGMDENVYSVLKVSYDCLESDELRYCFLICCLFKEDADISTEHLVRYGLGLNIFEGAHSVQEARNRVQVLVDDLKARCLLMDGETDDSATMHDVIRDFAHFLTSNGTEHVFLVRDGEEIIEWPNRDSCNRYTAISLLSHRLSELPEGLDCPKLEILIFERKSIFGQKYYRTNLLKIPSNFFQGMKQLKVLKMCYCSMPSIPASVALLKDLETLCLERSELGDLSQIGELKKLKVLSLAGSDFEELPREIGLLRNLMILDLTGCHELKVVPPNLISSLTQLECLYVLNDYPQWSWGGSNATIDELKHLRHLNTLEMHVSDFSLLPRDLTFQNLTRFQVFQGYHYQTKSAFLGMGFKKMLVVTLELGHNNTLPEGVKTLMKKAEALAVQFEGHKHPMGEYPHPRALSDLNEGGFKTLKLLSIMNNYSMKYLVDSSNATPTTSRFFPLLEKLRLEKLGLTEIFSDNLQDGSFGKLHDLVISNLFDLTTLLNMNHSATYPHLVNLRCVEISKCNKLKYVFHQSASTLLGQLQSLTVKHCESLEGIFLEDRPEMGDVVLLPKLQKLHLLYLPSLTSFYFQKNQTRAGQLFSTKVAFPALEELTLIFVFMPKEIWHPRLLPVNSFCSLTKVKIVGCISLITIFPSNVLPRLQNLREIELGFCDLLERVFDVDDTHKVTLHGLAKLRVRNLRADLIQFFFSEKIVFPALEHFELSDLKYVKEIWHPRLFFRENFHRLTTVRLETCKSLVTIFPSSVVRSLKNLERIEIDNCELAEEVIGFDDEDDAVSGMMIPWREIELQNLPNLIRFGQGTVGFPSLESMRICSCRKMKTFMGAHEQNLDGDFIQPFFHEKVDLPVLERLYIHGLNDLKELWHDRSQAGSFSQLRKLKVYCCRKLLNIIPLRLLLTMKNLKKISVKKCESVTEVVKIDSLIVGDQSVVDDAILTRSLLRKLKLKNIPKLTELWWNKDRSGIFSCPDLHLLEVNRCNGLKNIFVPSAIKHDMNIQKLKIADCSNMEEVVGEEENRGYSGDKLLFRQVKKLSLTNLPNLRSFCRGNYSLEWPSLSKMVMNNCPNMVTFCLGPVSTPQLTKFEDNMEVLTEGDNLIDIIQRRLFYIQETEDDPVHSDDEDDSDRDDEDEEEDDTDIDEEDGGADEDDDDVKDEQ